MIFKSIAHHVNSWLINSLLGGGPGPAWDVRVLFIYLFIYLFILCTFSCVLSVASRFLSIFLIFHRKILSGARFVCLIDRHLWLSRVPLFLNMTWLWNDNEKWNDITGKGSLTRSVLLEWNLRNWETSRKTLTSQLCLSAQANCRFSSDPSIFSTWKYFLARWPFAFVMGKYLETNDSPYELVINDRKREATSN